MHWHDGLLLGYTPMDAVHEEFVQCIAAIQRGTDAELAGLMAALERHAVQHFEEENHWMVSTEFPARDCHIDEHAAVLKSVRDVRALAEAGDLSECRRLAQALADWFPGHADYLDSALAAWMCKRTHGGKPVVIRRKLDLRSTETGQVGE
ncbi:hemerythrin [Ramlibacter rhizophilus]|uniref:Hemerythrin n=2 Tax=Ramlibacter rhizophilus TaxID=1781167 RepID=A0A4Z0BTD1_9BURK|nr:hemerythrin [Ramlibacter rhizophilus]